jgi:hypothetical protein
MAMVGMLSCTSVISISISPTVAKFPPLPNADWAIGFCY